MDRDPIYVGLGEGSYKRAQGDEDNTHVRDLLDELEPEFMAGFLRNTGRTSYHAFDLFENDQRESKIRSILLVADGLVGKLLSTAGSSNEDPKDYVTERMLSTLWAMHKTFTRRFKTSEGGTVEERVAATHRAAGELLISRVRSKLGVETKMSLLGHWAVAAQIFIVWGAWEA